VHVPDGAAIWLSRRRQVAVRVPKEVEANQMAADNAVTAPAAPMGEVTFPWWVTLIAGIAMIIVGLLLLAAPGAATAFLVQVLGWYWLIDGILRLVSIFIDSSGWGWKLCMGILGIILGIAVIQHPLWSAILVPTTLVLVVGFLGTAIGILQLISAFRGAGWGTGILGAFSIMLGLILMFNPLPGVIALPFILGFAALAGGIIAPVVAVGRRAGKPGA
jgi:uncharacterized membrane protein HdeD (DUF308 family)